VGLELAAGGARVTCGQTDNRANQIRSRAMATTKSYPEGIRGYTSRFDENGVLIVQDEAGNQLIKYDVANRVVTIPSGAVLNVLGIAEADPSVAGQVWADSTALKVSAG
jgi:hypothetical protein